jgi:hypothetical protein
MSKTKNPQINLSTSMSKWNAKITPKLTGEGKLEDVNEKISPRVEKKFLKKPNTAKSMTRTRQIKSTLN